jgi:hypothetical protein
MDVDRRLFLVYRSFPEEFPWCYQMVLIGSTSEASLGDRWHLDSSSDPLWRWLGSTMTKRTKHGSISGEEAIGETLHAWFDRIVETFPEGTDS